MSGKKSRYRKLWKRWLIIEAVSGVLCLLLSLNGDWELWLVLWLIFSFVCNALFGPGSMTGRSYSIQKERERRLLREFNEMWHKKNKKMCDKLSEKEAEEFFNRPPYCNDMTGSSVPSHDWFDTEEWD